MKKLILGNELIPIWLFSIGVAILLIGSSGCVPKPNENNSITIAERNLPRKSWVSEYPMVFIGDWDAMPIFRRRIGGNPEWQETAYYKEHSEETIKKYKDMGVTMLLLHFYKGFGLEAEMEHMEEAKKLASICKQNGLKVGVYVGSTIGYETFLLEKPEAVDWFVPDYMGQPVGYGDQTFRKRVYFMHPGFIEYMKRVVQIAIEDFKVDLIHFDNTSMRAEPAIFHHPMAVENFRTFLKNKYSPEMLKKRFGFSDMSYIEPPKISKAFNKMDDPLFQEWTDFRCQQLADYYGIMEGYIHSLNPDVAVCNNPHSGLSGNNTMWDQGVDYPRLLSHTDVIWTEEGNDPMVTEEGVLISKIRTYKMARTLHNRIFTYTTDSKLEMAEAMAYNQQGMGMVGGLKEMEGNQLAQGFELPEDQKSYIKFFHRNFEASLNVHNVADVAILHSFATMAYNNGLPYQSTYLYEQVLIQNKIPFDIIFDDQLKDISKYKVLILADQECLNDEKLEMVRTFVSQGGGLVASEFTSLYTEWRERKIDFGLKDLFKVSPSDWNGRPFQEDVLKIPIQKNQVGKGRVVYIPEIQASIPKPLSAAMRSNYWKLPVNNEVLIESVKWASDNNLSINIDAPLTVTMELTEKVDKSALILHLVNFDFKNSVKNVKVDVKAPEGKKITRVTVLTPDGRADEILQFKENGKQFEFVVPQLLIYNMVVMKLN